MQNRAGHVRRYFSICAAIVAICFTARLFSHMSNIYCFKLFALLLHSHKTTFKLLFTKFLPGPGPYCDKLLDTTVSRVERISYTYRLAAVYLVKDIRHPVAEAEN